MTADGYTYTSRPFAKPKHRLTLRERLPQREQRLTRDYTRGRLTPEQYERRLAKVQEQLTNTTK